MKNIQDLFRREKQSWLDSARSTARKLLKKKRYITIEDVLEVTPRPQYIHPNTTGMVFQDTDFVATGWAPSRRPLMNGRQVRKWTLRAK